jgi:hypothetical protein
VGSRSQLAQRGDSKMAQLRQHQMSSSVFSGGQQQQHQQPPPLKRHSQQTRQAQQPQQPQQPPRRCQEDNRHALQAVPGGRGRRNGRGSRDHASSSHPTGDHEMRGCEGYVPNLAAFANGGLQSSSTELGGPQQVARSSTRLHAPPGGRSSIVFG